MLAIIIPYYKLTFFRETLESLAVQTDKRFTVYIGNDASPEDPEDLLNEYEGNFNFIYKKFEENLGGKSLTKQWDRCIELMHGEEWFMILGDDDYLDLNYVATFSRAYEQNFLSNYNVIKCFSKIVDEKNDIILDKTEELSKLGFSAVDAFIAKSSGLINSSLSEHIFSHKRYEEIKFRNYPLAWHSDDFAILQFSKFGQIYILKEGVCYVRMSSINLSGLSTNIEEKKNASILFYRDIYENIPIKKLTQKQMLFFIYFWSHNFPKIYKRKITILYYKSAGFKGVILYCKIIAYNIYKKLSK